MKPDIFRTLKATLKTAVGIHHIGIWTNKMVDSADMIRRFPVALIEFKDFAYETSLQHRQECNAPQIDIHILADQIDHEAAGVFVASQNVFVAMQRAGFKRIRERGNYRGDELVEWIITFELPRFIDEDAVKTKTVIAPPPPEFTTPNTPYL